MNVMRNLAIALSIALLTAGSALAGPPLATDDAGTVGVSKIEVELNGSYSDDKETVFGVITKCSRSDAEMKITTGLYQDMAISLAIPYNINVRVKQGDRLVSNTNGLGDMTVELKYAFAELGGIYFAIKPTVIIPIGKYSAGLSEGRWQSGGTLIATKTFENGGYALHANLGYQYHGYRTADVKKSTRSDIWSGSMSGEVEVTKGLFAVAELGLATTADKSTSQLSVCATTGARYEFNHRLDLNAGIKLGLTNPEDDLTALYGIVLKF